MCDFQTLYHNDTMGYVVRCSECAKLQMGFGNLMLTFHEEDFGPFTAWIHSLKAEQHPSQSKSLRCITIPTPCEGMKLLLSINELHELSAMLEAADTELKSLAMLELFK